MAEPPVTVALPIVAAPSLNCTVPAAVPAATVTPAVRSTFCTPPAAVRVVVLDVATTVEVTRVDWDVVNCVLSVGTKVARSGWSPLTRSVRVSEALPEARDLVPTTTPLSRNSTVPAGVPDVARDACGQRGRPAGDDGAEGRRGGARDGSRARPRQAERPDAGGDGAVAVDRDGVRRAGGGGERHGRQGVGPVVVVAGDLGQRTDGRPGVDGESGVAAGDRRRGADRRGTGPRCGPRVPDRRRAGVSRAGREERARRTLPTTRGCCRWRSR